MSEFGKDLGVVHEAVVTGRKGGAEQEFWAALAHSEELFGRVVAFVVEALRVVFNLTAKIDRDTTGWTCIEPAEAMEGEFEPVLQKFLKPGEPYIGGEEMVKRAKEPTGLRHAEAMLREQEKIPVDYRKYCLVFPEVWQDPHGDRDVWCLYWDGELWYLHCSRLRYDFGSCYRLVASRKCQKSLAS